MSYPLSCRNDSTWCSWFCHRRTERRRGEGWLLADGHSEHWPLATRKAAIPHGCGVRLPLRLKYLMGTWVFMVLETVCVPPVLQVCCGFGGVCSSGMWYVRLCVSHPHCSKLSLMITFKLSFSSSYAIWKTDYICVSDSHVSFLSEVWLCLGALGISPSETKAVCQGLPAHRPRLSVSHLQEVSQEQTEDHHVCLEVRLL